MTLLLVTALSLAAGCGDDEDSETGTVTEAATDETTTATTAEAPTETVTQVVTQPCPETPAPTGCTAVEFVSLSIDKNTYNRVA
jgi:hypothetical protein